MSSLKRKQFVHANPVDPNEQSEVPNSVKMVLNLEELRDMIVAMTIVYRYGKYNDGQQKDIKSLRLVSKEWLSSVSRVLYKNGLPLIRIHFEEGKFRYFNPNNFAKAMDNFVEDFSTLYSTGDRNAPPFSINLSNKCFVKENFISLQNCLIKCGKGLVRFEAHLSEDISVPLEWPTFHFPALKKLDVHMGIRDQSVVPGKNKVMKATNLLKHLLEASSNLKDFHLWNCTPGANLLNLSNVLLPSTLTKLKFETNHGNDINSLIKNSLPNLSYLDLGISESQGVGNSLFDLLSNWRKSLKILHLDFDSYGFDFDKPFTQVSIPVMEKLAQLKLDGMICEFIEKGNTLHSCLPMLMDLELRLNDTGFQKWTANSVFPTVEKLCVQFCSNSSEVEEVVPMNLRNIQLTNLAFPNVKNLHVDVLGSEASAVQHIFREMSQLTSLTLRVFGSDTVENSDFWDALLTGVTPEAIKQLKVNLNNPESAIIDESGVTPSVRLLKELSSISLCTYEWEGWDKLLYANYGELLISEVSFIYAFFKMQNLNTFDGDGRFQVSTKMLNTLRPKIRPGFKIV